MKIFHRNSKKNHNFAPTNLILSEHFSYGKKITINCFDYADVGNPGCQGTKS